MKMNMQTKRASREQYLVLKVKNYLFQKVDVIYEKSWQVSVTCVLYFFVYKDWKLKSVNDINGEDRLRYYAEEPT